MIRKIVIEMTDRMKHSVQKNTKYSYLVRTWWVVVRVRGKKVSKCVGCNRAYDEMHDDTEYVVLSFMKEKVIIRSSSSHHITKSGKTILPVLLLLVTVVRLIIMMSSFFRENRGHVFLPSSVEKFRKNFIIIWIMISSTMDHWIHWIHWTIP